MAENGRDGSYSSAHFRPNIAEPGPEILARLASHPLRRRLFKWVLGQAQARLRDRENLRFDRTRLFARVRQIVMELGKRLASDGHLNEPRDIFYLELDEVLDFLGGTASSANLKALVSIRQAQFEEYRQIKAMPNRIVTRGSPYHGDPWRSAPPRHDLRLGESRQGQGCSPGVVQGRVRIVLDARTAQPAFDDILAARQTDPGWVLLFPGAKGLLVEQGSLLSHSAIIARELRLPAIVGIEGLTDWLRDGDWIEMDGATGLVRRFPSPPKSGPGQDQLETRQDGHSPETRPCLNEVRTCYAD